MVVAEFCYGGDRVVVKREKVVRTFCDDVSLNEWYRPSALDELASIYRPGVMF